MALPTQGGGCPEGAGEGDVLKKCTLIRDGCGAVPPSPWEGEGLTGAETSSCGKKSPLAN